MQKTLIMTVGLPRSGKSTWAIAQGYPVVCPDAIRLVLHGQAFRKEAEPIVWATAKLMVAALFEAGHDTVILDATNLTSKYRDEWKDARWIRQYQVFDTSKEECIKRAITTNQEYLVPVIERMDATKDYEGIAK